MATQVFFGINGILNRAYSIIDIIDDVKDIKDEGLHKEVKELLNKYYLVEKLEYFETDQNHINEYVDGVKKMSQTIEIPGYEKHEIMIIKATKADIINGIINKDNKPTIHKYPKVVRASPKKKTTDEEKSEKTTKSRKGKKTADKTEAEGETAQVMNVDEPPKDKKNKNKDDKKKKKEEDSSDEENKPTKKETKTENTSDSESDDTSKSSSDDE